MATPKLKCIDEMADEAGEIVSLIDPRADESDVSLVCRLVAYIDECLFALLIYYLRGENLTKTQIKQIDNAYSDRCKICYKYKLIDDGMKANLETINEVRNRFAHASDRMSFEDPENVESCNKLTVAYPIGFGQDGKPEHIGVGSSFARQRFVRAVSEMLALLHCRIKYEIGEKSQAYPESSAT